MRAMVSRRRLLEGAGALTGTVMLSGTRLHAAAAAVAEVSPITLPPPIGRPERLARLAQARTLMKRHGIGAILVESGASVDYLTGVQWSRSERLTATVVPVEGDPIIVTPFFEKPSVEESLGIPAEVRVWQEDEEPLKLVADFLRERGVAGEPVGFEETNRYFILDRLRQQLPAAKVVSANPVVRASRMLKSPAELALMQAAADVMIAAYRSVAPRIRAGMSPADIGAMIETAVTAHGGRPEFALVLLGEASAYPHGTHKPQRVEPGAVVLLDCGCSVHGYQADISRSFVFGARPTAEQRKVWEQMRRGQDIAFAAAKVGAPPTASMTPFAAPTNAGATGRATSCPAPRTAPGMASAWKCTSRSTWFTARRRRWRRACASPTSRASICRENSASGSRIAST